MIEGTLHRQQVICWSTAEAVEKIISCRDHPVQTVLRGCFEDGGARRPRRTASRTLPEISAQPESSPTRLPLHRFYEGLVNTQQVLNRKHLGWADTPVTSDFRKLTPFTEFLD